jgi:phosphatidylserine/phosphatidylglycerophosphate/cardiolipin synthase-like enzyme
LKLVAADSDRTKYDAGQDDFVVSPVNARKQLLALINRAEKELLIYDPKITDAEVLRALNERARKGVDVRIIGLLGRRAHHLKVRLLGGFRLHTRTIVRDQCEAFVGSQSLRKAELNSRREVGLIVRDAKVVAGLSGTFEADWAAKDTIESVETTQAARRELKKTLHDNMEKLSPLDPVVKEAIQEVVSKTDGRAALSTKELKETVEKAVKEAVRERVQEMVSESVEQ